MMQGEWIHKGEKWKQEELLRPLEVQAEDEGGFFQSKGDDLKRGQGSEWWGQNGIEIEVQVLESNSLGSSSQFQHRWWDL